LHDRLSHTRKPHPHGSAGKVPIALAPEYRMVTGQYIPSHQEPQNQPIGDRDRGDALFDSEKSAEFALGF
jgi:hypothetical protein